MTFFRKRAYTIISCSDTLYAIIHYGQYSLSLAMAPYQAETGFKSPKYFSVPSGIPAGSFAYLSAFSAWAKMS